MQCIQETKKITVHSRVRADIKCADRRQYRPIVSHTQHPVGDRVPPSRCTSTFRHVRHGAGDPAAARHFTRPSPPAASTDCHCPAVCDGGGGDSSARRPGPMAVALPRSRSPVSSPGRFGCATAGYVDRPQTAMGSRHRPGTAPGPAGDRPSPTSRPAGDPCR